jgi:hypothetical protein
MIKRVLDLLIPCQQITSRRKLKPTKPFDIIKKKAWGAVGDLPLSTYGRQVPAGLHAVGMQACLP